ncbi:MAG TPA: ribonuclease Z [Rectinemataceae bacterium]
MKFAFAGTSGGIQAMSSGNTSLVFADSGTSILVDVSGSPASALASCGINPVSLGAVILTHAHVDHIYGLPSLIHNMWLMGRTEALTIIGSETTLDVAHRLCALFSLGSKPGIFAFEWRKTEPGTTLDLGTFAVTTFAARHGLPTMGLVIDAGGDRIVYSADSAPLDAWPPAAERACVLVHEAAGVKDDEVLLNASGHSTARQAAMAAAALADMAPDAPAPCLMLCHLPLDRLVIEKMRVEAQSCYRGTVLIPEPLRLYDVVDFSSDPYFSIRNDPR